MAKAKKARWRRVLAAARGNQVSDLEQCWEPGVVVETRTPLHEAAAAGSVDAVRWLLTQAGAGDVDVEARDATGRRPMHEAACFGHSDVVRVLAEHGANIDAGKRTDWTPLMLAVQKQHVATALLLLELGADVHVRNKDGWTVVHMAARAGDATLLRHLVQRVGGIVEDAAWCSLTRNRRNPLHTAAAHGRVAALTEMLCLLRQAADPAALPTALSCRDKSDTTPWHEACCNGWVEVMAVLAQAGADVAAVTCVGQTGVHLAAINGHAEAVTAAVRLHRCDVAAVDHSGLTALHCAALRGHDSVIRALVALSCPVDAICAHGKTPLMLAANWARHSSCLLLIREAGADPCVLWHGTTPIAQLVPRDQPQLADLLATLAVDAATAWLERFC